MLFQYVLAALLVVQACLAQQARITDGHDAEPHEFPYQVSVVWGIPPIIRYRHVCGASIINENYVLTAGHCVTELPKIGQLAVQVGKHVINEKEKTQQLSVVAKEIVHPNYKGGVAQHDIAIFKLKTPLILNKNVAPVKLPEAGKIHTGASVLSGWGSISKKILPITPTVLQTVEIPIVDNGECLTAFDKIPGKAEIFDTQMCTGPIGSSVSACSGDSGGPLVQYDDAGLPEQVGIVSWGTYPCGEAGTPSVYTRVSSYIDWINSKIEA